MGGEYDNMNSASSPRLIIWTMQRSGGTALTKFLAELMGAEVLHEPFNLSRQYGPLVKAATSEADMLDTLQRTEAAEQNIKHCFEMVPDFVNPALIRATDYAGHVHVRLRRQDEVARIVSLAVADMTSSFFPESAETKYAQALAKGLRNLNIQKYLEWAKFCQARSASVDRLLKSLNPVEVVFEEFYGRDPSRSASLLVAQLQKRGMDMRGSMAPEMLHMKQGTETIASNVPNIAEFSRAIQAALH